MTPDDYVELTLQLIRTHLSPITNSVTAAYLGNLLRQAQPQLSWATFEFRSLKELLLDMKRRGLVDLGDTPNGALAVWPAEVKFELRPPSLARTFNPLRKPFWVAFVVGHPLGRRFFHRRSGEIRIGLVDPPSPGDEWVEITPVSDETQRSWAHEFLEKYKLYDGEYGREDQTFLRVMDSQEWFRALPAALSERDTALLKEWNRLRSSRISEAVRVWCAAHHVDPAVAFQSPMASTHARAQAPQPAMVEKSSARATVLAALERLPTAYLLEIPIPAKYLLQTDPASVPDHIQ